MTVNWLYARHWTKFFLIPFSICYEKIMGIRRLLYQSGWLARRTFPVPIIVVGNITVGGTGKTPFVAALVNALKAKGYSPAIVTRGYGGKPPHYPLLVTANTHPLDSGDEPLLLVNQTNVPVVADPNRNAAITFCLTHTDCNIIVSDDGLQHEKMSRDLEIVMVDGKRQLGNGYCLPAGPLRESPKRLKTVDFIVTQGEFSDYPTYQMKLVPKDFINVKTKEVRQKQKAFSGPVHAVAGIGNPKQFFDTLAQIGLDIIPHPFPDHYGYQEKDLQFHDNLPIVMTEKDAVKCEAFTLDNLWMLPVTAEIEHDFYDALEKCLGKFPQQSP